jgi:hypothetical protein
MNQKKYLKITIIIVVFSIIASSIYFNDRMIYSKTYDLINVDEINNISSTYSNEKGVYLEIDESEKATYIQVNNVGYVVDNKELFQILSKYKCKKSKIKYFPYSSDDIVAEISIHQNHKPKHILLGDFNIWYESNDKKAYNIIDGEKLLEEILILIN